MAIRFEALPARLGDCLLVECVHPSGRPWRMLVDGGPPDTWPLLEARLDRLPASARQIDLAVVTHVDSDHIGGFLPFVQSDFAGTNVGDFWFNGRQHLDGLVSRSIDQGESLGSVLTGTPGEQTLPWNKAFDGAAIKTSDTGLVELQIPQGGPHITVLSPDATTLEALVKKWAATLNEAQRGTRDIGGPDVPAVLGDLDKLAAQRSAKDTSVPNGSSIGLLLEHRGASLVLSGDGHGDVLTEGLKAVAAARGLPNLPVDLFKLPHHGSRGNVLEEMLAAAPAKHYVFSSNGDTFHHPDDAAVARVIVNGPPGATLWFNYRNARTERWGDPELRKAHGYNVRFPGRASAGAVVQLRA
jgi:hypothetical protein